MNIQIVKVEAGDWEILYKDGEEFTQGHSIDYMDVLYAIGEGGTLNYFNTYVVSDRSIEDMGWCFPPKFSDIPEDAFIEW